MKLLNELHTVRIPAQPGKRIEGLVRVRGIDARFGGQGVMIQQHVPETIVVRRNDGTVERTDIKPESGPEAWAPWVLAPLFALAIGRFIRRAEQKARRRR